MKLSRIIVLIVALAAGGIAALLAGRSDQSPKIAEAPVAAIDTTEILIAASDIGLGQTVSANELRWQIWPTAAANPGFIRRSENPDAVNQLSGSIARSPFVTGEPIREVRLIRAKGSGYLAAILPSGMRAISTDVTSETGAAGFILPNDRVDVILSRRGGSDRNSNSTSETILSNVRVLAIDQTTEEKGGQRVVVGKTATLELTQGQAEALVQSRTMGQLSLALRSLADASGGAPQSDERSRNVINILRFGVPATTTDK